MDSASLSDIEEYLNIIAQMTVCVGTIRDPSHNKEYNENNSFSTTTQKRDGRFLQEHIEANNFFSCSEDKILHDKDPLKIAIRQQREESLKIGPHHEEGNESSTTNVTYERAPPQPMPPPTSECFIKTNRIEDSESDCSGKRPRPDYLFFRCISDWIATSDLHSVKKKKWNETLTTIIDYASRLCFGIALDDLKEKSVEDLPELFFFQTTGCKMNDEMLAATTTTTTTTTTVTDIEPCLVRMGQQEKSDLTAQFSFLFRLVHCFNMDCDFMGTTPLLVQPVSLQSFPLKFLEMAQKLLYALSECTHDETKAQDMYYRILFGHDYTNVLKKTKAHRIPLSPVDFDLLLAFVFEPIVCCFLRTGIITFTRDYSLPVDHSNSVTKNTDPIMVRSYVNEPIANETRVFIYLYITFGAFDLMVWCKKPRPLGQDAVTILYIPSDEEEEEEEKQRDDKKKSGRSREEILEREIESSIKALDEYEMIDDIRAIDPNYMTNASVMDLCARAPSLPPEYIEYRKKHRDQSTSSELSLNTKHLWVPFAVSPILHKGISIGDGYIIMDNDPTERSDVRNKRAQSSQQKKKEIQYSARRERLTDTHVYGSSIYQDQIAQSGSHYARFYNLRPPEYYTQMPSMDAISLMLGRPMHLSRVDLNANLIFDVTDSLACFTPTTTSSSLCKCAHLLSHVSSYLLVKSLTEKIGVSSPMMIYSIDFNQYSFPKKTLRHMPVLTFNPEMDKMRHLARQKGENPFVMVLQYDHKRRQDTLRKDKDWKDKPQDDRLFRLLYYKNLAYLDHLDMDNIFDLQKATFPLAHFSQIAPLATVSGSDEGEEKQVHNVTSHQYTKWHETKLFFVWGYSKWYKNLNPRRPIMTELEMALKIDKTI